MTNPRLTYPLRRRGLDHDWFPHEPTIKRPRVSWPDGKTIALWITVPLEVFPLDAPAQPFRPLGGVMLGYPDLWNSSSRDYGARIGVYRIMRVLDGFKLRATAAVNAAAIARYPRAIDEMAARRWEFMVNGLDMGHVHHGGLGINDELALIRQARDAVSKVTGAKAHGWHSPGRSNSLNTLTLLAEHGFAYATDWANDDMPYMVTTPAGRLCAMPLTYEWSDRNLLVQHNLTVEEYEAQVLQAFRRLHDEGRHYAGGRILSLSITPWILGYPHRVVAFERMLGKIIDSGAVWHATGMEIADAFKAQVARS
jgi:peptidoglycan/xylan/chitin deacetylase (PgdA/CDA1 family)